MDAAVDTLEFENLKKREVERERECETGHGTRRKSERGEM